MTLRLLGSFHGRLAVIVAGAVALRLVYVLVLAREVTAAGDSQYFHEQANLLADGRGFIDPFILKDGGGEVPTAGHPPLYPLVLSVVSLMGGTGTHSHRALGALMAIVTITVIALIARRIGGDRAGLVAAGIAAVYPVMVAADGALMSEPLYGLLIAATLLTALYLYETRDVRLAVLLGVLIGLAALTRSEALGLVPLLAWPLAYAARERRVAIAAAATLACVLVIAPWTIRNTIAFDRVVPISNNDSTVLAGANCHAAYHGIDIGQWRLDCISPRTERNEARQAVIWREEGLTYVRENFGRLLVVVPVRVLRTWDLYQPRRQEEFAEGRARWAHNAGTVVYFLLLPLAVYGGYRLRDHARPALLILLAPVALAVLQSAIGYGVPRFRHGAEITIVVLAAFAVERLSRRAARRRRVAA